MTFSSDLLLHDKKVKKFAKLYALGSGKGGLKISEDKARAKIEELIKQDEFSNLSEENKIFLLLAAVNFSYFYNVFLHITEPEFLKSLRQSAAFKIINAFSEMKSLEALVCEVVIEASQRVNVGNKAIIAQKVSSELIARTSEIVLLIASEAAEKEDFCKKALGGLAILKQLNKSFLDSMGGDAGVTARIANGIGVN